MIDLAPNFYGRTQFDGRVENLKSLLISIYLGRGKNRNTLYIRFSVSSEPKPGPEPDMYVM